MQTPTLPVFEWQKLGHVWETPAKYDWMQSHAANPIAVPVQDNVYRVYFSCRNCNNVSSIGWFEVDITDPQTILNVSDEPVLSPGPLGSFDDSGVSIGSVVRAGDKQYLYYMGWNLSVTVPWRNSIGLAVSEDNGKSFRKISPAPILDRNPVDPYTISYPWVSHDSESGLWRMWYGSNLKWGTDMADMDHVINYATSNDGIQWDPQGTVIGIEAEGEYAFAKPCVIHWQGLWHLWYAFRGSAYRIGYAYSKDGQHWQRADEKAGISVSDSGWDSEMQCYPNVFRHSDQLYMFYNGNGYGKTGIGLAKLNVPQ